jgi:RimJ/RimL family protein N-acetyltransferase
MVDTQDKADLQESQEFTVRHASIEDARKIVMYLETILRDPMSSIADLDEMMLDEHRQRDHIRRIMSHPDALALVAEHGVQVIGYLSVEPGRRRKVRHVVEIGMSVHEDWRGRGVGTAMLESVFDWVEGRNNISKISLNVFSENSAAINLYLKSGFVEEGRLKDHIMIGDRYQDLVLMSKIIRR